MILVQLPRYYCMSVSLQLVLFNSQFIFFQVRELCIKLLPAYPSLAFVTVILHTLTELSIATLIHIPDQVHTHVDIEYNLIIRLSYIQDTFLIQTLFIFIFRTPIFKIFYVQDILYILIHNRLFHPEYCIRTPKYSSLNDTFQGKVSS